MSTNPNRYAATLYSDHNRSLRRYVLRIVPGSDASDADDVVQETFAATVKHLNNGKEITSRGFLFTIARNLVMSMFYRSRQLTETDAQPDMDEFETDCSPERNAMVQQKLDALSVAVAGLPKNYQEALVRRRVWGDSCKEIAADMGTTEHTVAVYVGRGSRLLKDYCEERNIDYYYDHE